ncbi:MULTISPECIES: YciN family protein [unclassified Brenneria]|uniref:YciN family protein n=1 Tax=unclassified Brenneria TaxID=2634434 RepID=UPI001555E4DB|nr:MULTISPECIES: YciN family protein [unclassified Brenneria]MBJ7220766.1 YciN family protein [Brenneria sp. L3-3C-1]MEE3642006.1 YciN family protein [Brenneria sp. L3_3C_1]MEE3649297.1 YciN family protein [Brenneria sp. HEZEL_4_2_4]NPC99250.1 YciN family protein [Brenneria sp. hezel4-2-4]
MSDEMQFTAEKSPIDRQTLLAEANRLIKEHDDYLHGMAADDVEQKNGVLVFKGEYFLDHNGLPTLKTTAVFNMFKHLAHVLSEKYYLVD